MLRLMTLKAGKEKLMNSAQKLFAKVYEQAQACSRRSRRSRRRLRIWVGGRRQHSRLLSRMTM